MISMLTGLPVGAPSFILSTVTSTPARSFPTWLLHLGQGLEGVEGPVLKIHELDGHPAGLGAARALAA